MSKKQASGKTNSAMVLIIVLIFIAGLAVLLWLKTGNKNFPVPFLPSVTPEPTPLTAEQIRQIQDLNISESKKEWTFQFAGISRSYLLHLPTSFDRKTKIPVVFAFHGAGGDGKNIEDFSGLSDFSDKYSFIAVYPNGRNNQWYYTPLTSTGKISETDDTAFSKALLAELSARYPVDLNRVFAVGFSNGGYFIHDLACVASDTFSGFAAVASALPQNVTGYCKIAKPHPFMMVIGKDDQIYYGGISASQGYILSADESLKKWAVYNQCNGTLRSQQGPVIQISSYAHCGNDSSVLQIIITGVGHDWIRGEKSNEFDTTRNILEFFGFKTL